MRHLRRLALVVGMLLLCNGASFADSVIGYLDLDTSLNTVPAVGQVIFTLEGDGTIGASLWDYGPATIVGFGFNSLQADLPESGFTPTTPDNPYGWGDSFGTQPSGFLCTQCGLQESWIIGNPGDYTSVYQVLNGGSQSSVDFFLYDSNGAQWGGDAQSYSSTPEPGSVALLGTGLLGLLGFVRRRFRIA
ncbi:MAG TPA: PEP-CTERM sorting domain-containing protein [Terriglobia bacterium]|nr:PEP-CTERM sorting domain-containing protein [Terriglobia bacterium]